MGTSELIAAFNLVGSPSYTCTRATLHYDSSSGQQMQVMTFYGNAADGTPFTASSDPLGDVDVNVAAGAVAQKLITP